MPETAFNLLRPAIETSVGGATVQLISPSKSSSIKSVFSTPVDLTTKQYLLTAHRGALQLTRLETELLTETASAFKVLFTRCESDGYRAHLRTAISAAAMDVALARFLRGDQTERPPS